MSASKKIQNMEEMPFEAAIARLEVIVKAMEGHLGRCLGPHYEQQGYAVLEGQR